MLLPSDLCAWYDATQTNRLQAVDYGRGLQALNIVRNRTDDRDRGVEFYPPGRGDEEQTRPVAPVSR